MKLLELLVLKPDDAKFFNEYKNKFMDFNKLMILTENKKIQEKIFSSKLYKEYALKKCNIWFIGKKIININKGIIIHLVNLLKSINFIFEKILKE